MMPKNFPEATLTNILFSSSLKGHLRSKFCEHQWSLAVFLIDKIHYFRIHYFYHHRALNLRKLYFFLFIFVYVFFIFSKYEMIYMYFRRWRLTDSLLMADMSKVYIMRRGWTLCLDGIGLAISRSKVGHYDYQVIITVRKADITRVEHQTCNQFAKILVLVKVEGSKLEVVIFSIHV